MWYIMQYFDFVFFLLWSCNSLRSISPLMYKLKYPITAWVPVMRAFLCIHLQVNTVLCNLVDSLQIIFKSINFFRLIFFFKMQMEHLFPKSKKHRLWLSSNGSWKNCTKNWKIIKAVNAQDYKIKTLKKNACISSMYTSDVFLYALCVKVCYGGG